MNTDTMFSSASPEWYTPDTIIEKVLKVFGKIDLDPCSPTSLGPVPADKYYTPEQDGLSLPWYGRVYMNPPYGREIRSWVEKAIN